MAPERRNAAASTAGTPYGTPGSVRSDWSTASNSNRNSNRSESGGRQLVSQVKPSLSLLKQEILTVSIHQSSVRKDSADSSVLCVTGRRIYRRN